MVYLFLLITFLLTYNAVSNHGAPAGDDDVNFDDLNTNSMSMQGGIITDDGSSWKDPNSKGYSTWTTTTSSNDECVQEIKIKGNGIDDTFNFPCTAGADVYSSADDIILVVGNTTINSLYSKEPGKMQVIQDGKCSLRTYTNDNGKITASTSPVSGSECEAMKKEHTERMEKWETWNAETFPPSFPFGDTKPGETESESESEQTQSPVDQDNNPLTDDFLTESGDDLLVTSDPQGQLLQNQNSFPWNINPFGANTNSGSNNPQGQLLQSQNTFPWNSSPFGSSLNPSLNNPQGQLLQSPNFPWNSSPLGASSFQSPSVFQGHLNAEKIYQETLGNIMQMLNKMKMRSTPF